jgi:cytochrome c553
MLHFPLHVAIASLLLLAGCDNKEANNQAPITPKSTQAPKTTQTTEAKESTQEAKSEVKENVAEVATGITQAAKETQEKVADKITNTTDELAKKLEQTAQEGQKRLEKVAQEGQERLEKVASEVKETLPEANTSEVAIVAPAKAKVCASCHGENGEKVALGKSKIINELSKQEIIDSLKGYQDGTYGGAMKAVMLGQVKNLSNEDIEELAEFYSAN